MLRAKHLMTLDNRIEPLGGWQTLPNTRRPTCSLLLQLLLGQGQPKPLPAIYIQLPAIAFPPRAVILQNPATSHFGTAAWKAPAHLSDIKGHTTPKSKATSAFGKACCRTRGLTTGLPVPRVQAGRNTNTGVVSHSKLCISCPHDHVRVTSFQELVAVTFVAQHPRSPCSG